MENAGVATVLILPEFSSFRLFGKRGIVRRHSGSKGRTKFSVGTGSECLPPKDFLRAQNGIQPSA